MVLQNLFGSTPLRFAPLRWAADLLFATRSVRRSSLLVAVIMFAALISTSCGCYQRTIAPAATPDVEQVEQLKREIKNLDWD